MVNELIQEVRQLEGRFAMNLYKGDISPEVAYTNSKVLFELGGERSNSMVELISDRDGSNMFVELKKDIEGGMESGEPYIRLSQYGRSLLNVKAGEFVYVLQRSDFSQKEQNGFLIWLLGNRKLDLKAVRPGIGRDEAHDVVRLADGDLKLLGIQEGDKVIVSYGENRTSLSALLSDAAPEQNSIGLPSYIRRIRLGLLDVATVDIVDKQKLISGSVVRVERDAWFALGKNINGSVVPIFAAIFALYPIVKKSSLVETIGVIFVAIMLAFYASLSAMRLTNNRKDR